MTDNLEFPGMHASNGSALVGLAYNSIIQIINAGGDRLTEDEARERERQYLRRVMYDCSSLDWLSSVRYQDEDTPGTRLDSVYTALLTLSAASEPETKMHELASPEQEKRLSAVEVLNREARWVLTGAPGSGKSAFVNFLSLCLAGEALGDPNSNIEALTEPLPDEKGEPQEERQPWDHGTLVPVRVILRDFAVSTQFPAENETGEAGHVASFVEADLKSKRCGGYFQILEARLRDGTALVLFDGLDEVPQAGERRKRLLQCISAFAGSYEARILVTCRPYAYEQAHWRIHNFEHATLADFNAGQILRFVDRWYASRPEYNPQEAKERAGQLKSTLLERAALREVSTRPLLLTLTAYLHANHYELPERRADLYERLLELLIEKWEKARFKADDSSTAQRRDQYSLAEFLKIGMDSIRLVLERLAFEAHAEQTAPAGTADIPAQKLTHHLYCLADPERQGSLRAANIGRLSEYLRDRVGILYQRGGADELDAVYTFPHRSFQEYLAASYFRREEQRMFQRYAAIEEFDEWPELAAYLGRTDPDRWREVVLLAGGIKSLKEPGPVWDLLDSLVPEKPEGEALTREQAWGLRLAGEILAENLKRDQLPRKKEHILARICQALPSVLRTDQLAALERIAAGACLAKIGDPRSGVVTLDDIEFCLIPRGTFLLSGARLDEEDYDYEVPREECDIPYTYWLSRFLVTVAQFNLFILESRRKLKEPKALTGSPNQPVRWIDYYDASAFCRWLTKRWQDCGWLRCEQLVALPSTVEWEKAAVGGLEVPVAPSRQTVQSLNPNIVLCDNIIPRRNYPWGDFVDPDRANYSSTEIHSPSTVGCFPNGASPYGCEELSGNVWEWIRAVSDASSDSDSDTERGLRGGSFHNIFRDIRCVTRQERRPIYLHGYLGFRVAIVPSC